MLTQLQVASFRYLAVQIDDSEKYIVFPQEKTFDLCKLFLCILAVIL